MKNSALKASVVLCAIFLSACASKGPPTAYDYVQADEKKRASESTSQPEVASTKTRSQTRVDVAVAHYENKSYDRALDASKEAVDLNSDNVLAWMVLALAQEKMNLSIPVVVKTYESALGRFPENADLEHNYGWYLCQQKIEKEGYGWLEKASQNLKNKTPAKTFLAMSKCGPNSQTNIESARKALDLIPNWAEGWLGLASLYQKGRRYDLAHKALSKYFELTGAPSRESYLLGMDIAQARGDKFQVEQYRGALKEVAPHRLEN